MKSVNVTTASTMYPYPTRSGMWEAFAGPVPHRMAVFVQQIQHPVVAELYRAVMR